MKKLLLTLALMLGTLTAANAQFGIIGGWTTAKAPSTVGDLLPKNASLFHAGVAYKFEIGPFFALQPALVYQGKATYVNQQSSLYSRSNFLELELGTQVGIDLLALRPYFLFEPFIGVDLGALNKLNGEVSQVLNDAKKKFEYGFDFRAVVHELWQAVRQQQAGQYGSEQPNQPEELPGRQNYTGSVFLGYGKAGGDFLCFE